MKRFLTTGFLGAILGIVIGGAPADASLISRSFLDQALTDYATTTALDLKANQSDFTDLNTQISDSVDVLRELIIQGSNSYEFVNGMNPEKYPDTISGAFSLLYQYLDEFAGSILNGWTDPNGNQVFGLRDITEDYYNTTKTDIRKLFDGWRQDDRYYPGLSTLSNYVTVVEDAYNIRFPYVFTRGSQSTTIDGVDYTGPVYPLWKLSEEVAKIGTLPTEIVIGNSNGSIDMFNITKRQSVSLPKDYTLSDFIQDMYYGSFGVNAGLDSSPFYGLSDIIDHVMYGGITGEASPLTDKQYKGLIDLTLEINKIGTLPSGNFPNFPGSDLLFPWLNQPLTYPASLAELINAIYGDEETIGLLPGIIARFPIDTDGDGDTDVYTGLIPNFRLANDANNLANANTAKIGTLPTDTTVAGMMGNPVLIGAEQTIIPLYDLILLGSKGQLAINPINGTIIPFPLLGLLDLTHRVNKIGDLPTEYATVGAALTAIKGIAEEAKAAAVAAIPDPKAEGSSGKYVLTVDIIGDNATYRWEKIDRSESESTTTE